MKWALLVHHLSSPFERVLFKTFNLLSQTDYTKAILILLDLYGSPHCFMMQVSL